jgi:hypothetical protein
VEARLQVLTAMLAGHMTRLETNGVPLRFVIPAFAGMTELKQMPFELECFNSRTSPALQGARYFQPLDRTILLRIK